jgi:hypothetical protein
MQILTYLECDVPEGLTLTQWRRERNPAAPVGRLRRMLCRLLGSPPR